MGINAVRVAGIMAVGLLTLSCAEGHCRRMQEAPVPAKAVEAPPEPATKAQVDNGHGRVYVYKYDGSLQCGGGKPVSPDSMAKELGGLKIFSKAKKPDGLMHIQVCGSITGMANVFEIEASELKKAEKLGFKKWSYE